MADRFAWSASSPSESATPTRDFQKISGNSKKSAAPIYGGRFRVLSGGSKWQSALPTGHICILVEI